MYCGSDESQDHLISNQPLKLFEFNLNVLQLNLIKLICKYIQLN